MKSISGRRLCKILEARGWMLKRINGSHHIYTHLENDNILTVPVHGNKDLKRGTLLSLMKLAKLSDGEI